jgi:DNA polymerase III subunit delta
MKIDARQIPGFLRNPGACRAVLLHGEDAGLIRSRAEALTRAVLGAADDPFRLAWLSRDEIGNLPAEASSMALTGGRRVIRVREATDAALPALQRALAQPGDALIVLEAPDLPSRGKLKAAMERMPEGAAIACYPEEGRALDATIRNTLSARRVTAVPEALEWLRDHLGADQAATQAELEKLALFVGDGGSVDLEAAQACIGDAADVSLDQALFAATVGDRAAMDRALALAFAEGAASVGVLRAALMHVQRLHRVRLMMEQNRMGAAEAAKLARPPVFFRRLPAFTAALSLWTPASLLRALEGIAQAERECKRTGARDEVVCQRVLAALAENAAAARRRVSPG